MEGSRQAADQASIAGPSSDSNGLLGKRKREDQGEINPGNTFAQPGTRLASFDPVKDSIDAQPFPYLNGGRGSPRTDQQPSPHMIRTSARGSSSDSSPVSPKSETYPQHNHAAHGGDRKKRQFARRTKTGCLTCRGRKKKCDETKPFCGNCTRGKFTCEGYSEIKPRTSSSRQNDIGMLQTGRSEPDMRPPSSLELGHRRQTSLVASQESAWSSTPFAGQSVAPDTRNHWAQPSWSAPREDCQEKRRSHQTPPGVRPPSATYALAEPPLKGDARERERMDSARFMPHVARPMSSQRRHMSEKEKMLRGQPHQHYTDLGLRQDRASCSVALERYNDAARLSRNAHPSALEMLFSAIVAPEKTSRQLDTLHVTGSVGHRTLIEAPFTCDYGYNVHLGDDVVIEAGCVMQDSCTISIGSRTIIGPNVKFYGRTVSLDPSRRAGARSCAIGGSITIEEDCFIGGDVIIMGNRTIKRGSVIGAGTVVSRDVTSGTVFAGNPMRLIRRVSARDPNCDLHALHIQMESNAAIKALAELVVPPGTRRQSLNPF